MKATATAALAVCLLALAGCGGGHHTTTTVPAAVSQSATGSVHPAGWGGTPAGVQLPAPLFGLGAAQTATMYDAISVGAIPAHPFAQAGYTAGAWPDYEAERRAWPTAHTVSVAIRASLHADCLDVEPGDAVPSQAGPWARADIAAGFAHPCLYSDLSEMPAVRASLAAAGLGRSSYFLWLAWYRRVPGLLSGYDAVQWTDACLGRNLDCSTVSLAFLSIAQPPYVPPVLPICFTKRETRNVCAAVKAKVASQNRAAASSTRAYIARGCPGIVQRRDWFAAHLSKPPARKHAYRARALAASRRAYQRNACGTFAQRASWFAAAAKRLQEAN